MNFQNLSKQDIIAIVWDLSYIIGVQYFLCKKTQYVLDENDVSLLAKCEKRIEEIFYDRQDA